MLSLLVFDFDSSHDEREIQKIRIAYAVMELQLQEGKERQKGRLMRIEYLKEAVTLAETLNFSRAANRLFISQPLLSKHVAALEKEIGIKIFLRTKHEVRLTRAGKTFVSDARRVVAEYDSLMANIASDRRALHVGFVKAAVSSSIFEIQKRFREVRPDIEVQFFSYTSLRDPRRMLEADAVDIVLGAERESWIKGAYNQRELVTDAFRFIIREDDSLASQAELSAADIKDRSVLIPDEMLVEQDDALRNHLRTCGVTRFDAVLHDVDSLPIMLEKDKSISVGLKSLEHYYEKEGNLRFVPIKGIDIDLALVAVWKQERESDAILSLVDIAQDVMSRQQNI